MKGPPQKIKCLFNVRNARIFKERIYVYIARRGLLYRAFLSFYLSCDQVVPSGAVGVLKVGHVHVGPAVQRIDHHLAVGRSGDLNAAVLRSNNNQ